MILRDLLPESDNDHFDTLEKTGFWGKRGAGCLFLARDTGRFLVAHRSQLVQEPGTWGTWGGAIDSNETPEQAVSREVREESGYSGKFILKHVWTYKHPSGFEYHNYIAVVEKEFSPQLNWETEGYRWVEKGDWPSPLHPGLRSLLDNSFLGNTNHQMNDVIQEAMPASLYRDFTKKWDKTYLQEVFKNSPFKKDKNAYRLYFPLKDSGRDVDIPVPPEIDMEIKKHGYTVVDYKKGYAQKDKRVVRLSKLLPPELQQLFANDPNRGATKKTLMCVVSRHPYDVGGMSTGRGWDSCQTLPDGSQCDYVPKDIKAGSLVVYLISPNDLNITNPTARILIKPYTRGDDVAYGSTNKVYGDLSQSKAEDFMASVDEFVDWLNQQVGASGIYSRHRNVYPEGPSAIAGQAFSENEMMEFLQNTSDRDNVIEAFKHFIIRAVSSGITPSEKVQIATVQRYGDAIEYIITVGITPSERVQLAAVQHGGYVIADIIDAGITPSERVQIAAVQQNGRAIRYIIDAGITPSESVQVAAVKRDGYVLKSIIESGIEPSESVQVAAVQQSGYVIADIIDAGITPSERVQLAAVKQNGRVIKFIIEKGIIPSERVQLAAVKQHVIAMSLLRQHQVKIYPSVEQLYKELKNEDK